MVTSGMDKKLKVFDIRAFRPTQSYFLPAGASCLSLSHRGLLSAATGDTVQVAITLCSFDLQQHSDALVMLLQILLPTMVYNWGEQATV